MQDTDVTKTSIVWIVANNSFREDDRLGQPYENTACTNCHDLGQLVDATRPGYWHFELSHRSILEGRRSCTQCHGDLAPYDERSHRVDPFRRAQSCGFCHGLQAID